jgi:hypothetical protein
MDGVLLEVCWRMRRRSGCVFKCGIYVTTPNLLKVVVVEDQGRDGPIVFSQEVQDIEVARKLAESSRLIVLAKETFNQLLH